MHRTTTKALAGVAVAALAAAGVAALVNYRRGQKLDPEAHAHLDELEARLTTAAEPAGESAPGVVGRVLDSLHRNRGIPVERLRHWIAGIKQGTLSPEQATVAESELDALEREADQSGV